MPTETKSPTSNTTIVGGWVSPQNAYSSDDLRTSTSADNAEQEYAGYGFGVPDNATINQCKVKVECYSNAPLLEDLYIKVWDGNQWSSEFDVPYTSVEQVIEIDVSSFLNTPAKVNAAKTRIRYHYAGGGGDTCFPPDVQAVRFKMQIEEIVEQLKMGLDWKNDSKFWNRLAMLLVEKDLFEHIRLCDLKVGDIILTVHSEDETTGERVSDPNKVLKKPIRLFVHPAKITGINVHEGIHELIHVFFEIHHNYMNAYAKNPGWRKLLGLKERYDSPILGDMIATSNHPVMVRGRGLTSYGALKIGDRLNEYVCEDGIWFTRGVPIVRIDKEIFEGKVYDVQTEDRSKFLGRYLLAYYIK